MEKKRNTINNNMSINIKLDEINKFNFKLKCKQKA